MKALILAGGKGQRLRPYTTVIPKPLMPIGDMPVLELLLRQLKGAGVTEAVLAVNHLRQLIEAFFGDGRSLGIHIKYTVEEKPLGTAGPIAAVLDVMPDVFFVLNGDLLTTLDFGALWRTHEESAADVTIATYKREVKIDFGVIEKEPSGSFVRYIEKPTYEHDVSMGCYVVSKRALLSRCEVGKHLDMPDLITRLSVDGCRVNCYQSNCFWLDIGRPEDYQLANEIMEQDSSRFGVTRTR